MQTQTPARNRLATLLERTTRAATGADSAEMRLPPDALEIDVAGHGRLTYPIRAAEAKQLIELARPAQFGHGTETLTDTTVRDTWEITPDQVTLRGAAWRTTLAAALEGFRMALGLPVGSRLEAELHSFLIYGKGQFFLPHQDSEKADDMVATMVVALPSIHTGGALVVDDGGRERSYRGARDELVAVAFYADRRHEVKPVRSGHRVTLTFNLSLKRRSAKATPNASTAEAAQLLREHFATHVAARYTAKDLGAPTRLAFLLDHEYTERGLAGGRLKGVDAERVAVLRAAADEADCESVLALSEIRETWDAATEYVEWRGDRRWSRDWDEDPEEEVDEDTPRDYDLDSLLDDEISLGWWTAGGAKGERITLPLDESEVCAATPTHNLTPYQSEFEGFMGNYGNTVDRWYRRAAVVVWPRDRAFVARAEAGSEWALRSLQERIAEGTLEQAKEDALSMEPFWTSVREDLIPLALDVAAGLEDPLAALTVLGPIDLETLSAEHAAAVGLLQQAYGTPWVADLLKHWAQPDRYATVPLLAWMGETLMPFCTALRDAEQPDLADAVVEHAWQFLTRSVSTVLAEPRDDRRSELVAELAPPVAGVLAAAADGPGQDIARHLTASGPRSPELVVPVLRAQGDDRTSPALGILVDDCREKLSGVLQQPQRSPDDWSIDWTGCGCDLCERLSEFLAAGNQSLDWSLATDGRQHIHHQVEIHGLPVRHTTRRKGRPYTLVLKKTSELHAREARANRAAQTDLAWLESISATEGP